MEERQITILARSETRHANPHLDDFVREAVECSAVGPTAASRLLAFAPDLRSQTRDALYEIEQSVDMDYDLIPPALRTSYDFAPQQLVTFRRQHQRGQLGSAVLSQVWSIVEPCMLGNGTGNSPHGAVLFHERGRVRPERVRADWPSLVDLHDWGFLIPDLAASSYRPTVFDAARICLELSYFSPKARIPEYHDAIALALADLQTATEAA